MYAIGIVHQHLVLIRYVKCGVVLLLIIVINKDLFIIDMYKHAIERATWITNL